MAAFRDNGPLRERENPARREREDHALPRHDALSQDRALPENHSLCTKRTMRRIRPTPLVSCAGS
ncbi:hypothetical protein AB0C96_34275 [Streptomyces sp. NPDC048506]|uniref:hypothetical protein n=1 Tax=Streptomyces sp. NPDC048506 TaxID=3155028 RepID=UPI00341B72BE